MTEWRDVPGYEGLYQISIDTPEGKCRCLNYHRERKIKELSDKPGIRDKRIYWGLWKDGKRTCYQAAKWIALSYPELVENEYFEGAEIDHIDTNRLNNHPSNLRWVTRKQNLNNPLTRKHISKTMTGKNLNNPSYSKTVCQYSIEGILIATYPSTIEAHRQTGIHQGHISECCNGKANQTGGYIWRYSNI